MSKLAKAAVLLGASALGSVTGAQAQSLYGCTELSARNSLPSIEGKNGVFYRLDPDLHMFQAFSDETVAQVAELAEALQRRGTTLVYVPIPTKSLAMPAYLTSEAADFGYDIDIATSIYTEALRRLDEKGVTVVDVRRALVSAGATDFTFFQSDHRWSPLGSSLTAEAVANRLLDVPGIAKLPRGNYATTSLGAEIMPSAMRERIQRNCLMTIPEVQTIKYKTSQTQGVARASEGSIFGGRARSTVLALVGTEYSLEDSANFAGFLAERTGLETVHYAVDGGGAFTAISTYLTSEAFAQSPPAVLVWENPFQYSLAKYGDQPMRELIAAASGECRVPINVQATTEPNVVRADLRPLDPNQNFTLFLDSSAEANKVTFKFRSREGFIRTRSIARSEGEVATGRFFMPLTGLWEQGAETVDIEINAEFGPTPRVSACFY